MTSTRDFAIKLARQAVGLPLEDQVLIIDALLITGHIPNECDRRHLLAERDNRIRTYRADWYGDLAGNAAARQIDHDLQNYISGEWRQHKHRVTPPETIDIRRRALFAILKCGSGPRYEALRKILRG